MEKIMKNLHICELVRQKVKERGIKVTGFAQPKKQQIFFI
jgi:hypothetical protein